MIRPYIFGLLLLAACNPSAEHKGTDSVSSGAQVLEDVLPDTVLNDGTSVDTSRGVNDAAVDTVKPLQTRTEKQVEQKIEKTTTPPQSELEGKVKGTWQWSYTSCCSRMPKIIKDTSAQATLLKFNAGKVQQYNGKTFQSADTYTLTENDKGVPQIKFSKKNYLAYLNFKGDTLVMNYGYMDLQTEYYIRIAK